MYAAGAPHPHKAPSVDFLTRVARGEVDAVIDPEVLQEILHRYRAPDRWEEGRRVFDLARTLFTAVVPVNAEVLDRARMLRDAFPDLMAREATHGALRAPDIRLGPVLPAHRRIAPRCRPPHFAGLDPIRSEAAQ